MSKHRPSNPLPPASPDPARRPRSVWERRVFRNCFTRRGKTCRLKNWSFKVQYQGRRRTFSLAGRTRAEAALEAQQIYEAIVNEGWQAALELHRLRRRGGGAVRSEAGAVPLLKSDLAYWEHRLIQRRYREARLRAGAEFSARIEHEGTHAYFPLGTDDPKGAAATAREIYQTVVGSGWAAAFTRFERELTLAISWSDNPLAITYATLFTFLTTPAPAAPPAGDRRLKPLLVLEPDVTAHSCLRYWLDRQPGFTCRAVHRTAAEALEAIKLAPDAPPVLVLLNRLAPDAAPLVEALRLRWPELPVFPYRLHEDSDQIFISTSGVSGGYIFRRRLPTALFDPLQPIAAVPSLTAADAARRIRNYFQSFFGDPPAATPPLAPVALTNREQEVLNLISRGCLDKEIAHLLDISIWTVHNHLKNIYDKLGVHNRTEAVLKYLQR